MSSVSTDIKGLYLLKMIWLVFIFPPIHLLFLMVGKKLPVD